MMSLHTIKVGGNNIWLLKIFWTFPSSHEGVWEQGDQQPFE